MKCSPSQSESIYLDNNATTEPLPEVIEAMREALDRHYRNPASQHRFGREARQVLEDAREEIVALLGGSREDRLIFTSGGTEANNWAISGLLAEEPAHIVASPLEHASILAPLRSLSARGWDIDMLPIGRDGTAEVDALPSLLRAETKLVVLLAAHNETGVIQPIEQVCSICSTRKISMHTDACQLVGKVPIDFRELQATSLSIAPHKFYGPLGIGGLLVRHDAKLRPLLLGGAQQAGLRPGTESVFLVVGFLTALRIWKNEEQERANYLALLRDRFEAVLVEGNSEVTIIGNEAERLPHTSNIAVHGVDRQALLMALDQIGIACSTGSACASGAPEPSPAHVAMGLDPSLYSSALRFSFGFANTPREAEQAARSILKISNELRHPN